jgi:hypothetical protein
MSNEIKVSYPSGSTLYAVVRDTDGLVYYIAGAVLEAWGTSGRDADDYDIALTGDNGDLYVGDFPSAITTRARYVVQAFIQSGGSPADSDNLAGAEQIWWDVIKEVTESEFEEEEPLR